MLTNETDEARLNTLERQMKRLLEDRSIRSALDGSFANKWPSRIMGPEGDAHIIVRQSGGALSSVPIAEYSADDWAADDDDTEEPTETSLSPIWIPATQFYAVAGESTDLVTRGSTSNAYEKTPAWAMDASTAETVVTVSDIPSGYDGSAFSIVMFLAAGSSGSGNVIMEVYGATLESEAQIDQASEFSGSATIAMPAVLDQVVVETFSSLSLPASGPLRLAVRRNAADGGDTFANDVWFIGVRIEFTGT